MLWLGSLASWSECLRHASTSASYFDDFLQVATNPLPAIHVAPSLESPQRGQIRIASPQSQPDMMADEVRQEASPNSCNVTDNTDTCAL